MVLSFWRILTRSSPASWPAPVLSNDNTQLGTLILEYSRDIYSQRFLETIRKVAASTAIVLLIPLPLGWLWGKQIASSLLRLSKAIRQVAQAPAATRQVQDTRG